MILALWVGSGAWADLNQEQLTGIGLTNTIALLGGDQAASSMQNLVVDNAQVAENLCGPPSTEHLFASVGQSASADGSCGLVDVIQGLGIDGLQRQKPGEQVQTLGVGVGQSMGKAVGLGAAQAVQTLVVDEGQSIGPICLMDEYATVMGMQSAETFGQPGATSVVDGSMAVSSGQSQAFL
jgi:hypothetical protein